ncbi:MAG: TAXI family TRAP transporter solute-binding subunit [Alphaproteobacteria bacterium]|nr:TAXI family TRAP transporter solute-binding subunit [Alphaproteobacteria bacterium]
MTIVAKSLIPLAAAAALAMGAGPVLAQAVGMGTGKQGFYTYSAGAAISKVASDKGLAMRIQPFGGTSAYVPAVNAKEVEFGLANELETSYAVTGTAIYKGKQQADVRVVSILTPLKAAFFVQKDSPVKSIADLKGKRVPVRYSSQRVLHTLTEGMLANGGLTLDDIQPVPVPNVAGGADDFAAGKADAFFFALGAGKVRETDAKVGGIRALEFDRDPKAIARARKHVPVAYALEVGPEEVGVTRPTRVMAYDYLVLTSTKVSEDKVYQLAKIMHENKAELVAGFKALNGFDPKRMTKDLSPVQFHPGAVKYYKEIGAWPPKN